MILIDADQRYDTEYCDDDKCREKLDIPFTFHGILQNKKRFLPGRK